MIVLAVYALSISIALMRLDKYLVEQGHAPSRTRASTLISEGSVSVNGRVLKKVDYSVKEGDRIVCTPQGKAWVSRGAYKLLHVLEHFDIDVAGKVCLDIGASTGGFTEVLLSKGARKVYALDVGHGQLHHTLTGDARVENREGVHIRSVEVKDFPERPECIVVDVSFISLTHVLPKAHEILLPGGDLIALIKPQFEVGKDSIGKGIVDPEYHQGVCDRIQKEAEEVGFNNIHIIPSPIEGGDGNKEFLLRGKS